MYQTKFLKPLSIRPVALQGAQTHKNKKPVPSHIELSSTLTISNDLGETNFYGDATLKLETKLTLKPSHAAKYRSIDISSVKWEAGKRAVDVLIQIPLNKVMSPCFISLEVSVDESAGMFDRLNTGDITSEQLIDEVLPRNTYHLFQKSDLTIEKIDKLIIFPISSEFIQIPQIFNSQLKTDRRSIRKIGEIQVYEELSGSIARHLWDAGLFIVDGLTIGDLFKFINQSESKKIKVDDKLNVLELGTGIGLVSIHLKKKLSQSMILSTDLIDAKEIYENNLQLNDLNADSSIQFEELDWERSSKTGKIWDLIVTTDCTYNPLYYDSLIKVLKKETDTNTLFLIVHKFREPLSESEFFHKISDSGFKLQRSKLVNQNGQYLIFMGLYKST